MNEENQDQITVADAALADVLLRGYPETDPSARKFLCYLSRACREGHLCVQVQGDRVVPELADGPLPKQLEKGSACIPSQLITDVTAAPDTYPATPLCRRGDFFYFQKYWLYETSILNDLRRIIQDVPALACDKTCLEKALNVSLEKLTAQQAMAIRNAANTCLSIICGGPGTGKTYTAGMMIRLIEQALPEPARKSLCVVITAPTGKAACNLEKSLRKACGAIDVNAKTLHALLGMRSLSKPLHELTKTLDADIIVVDEASMIDVKIMAALLAAVKPGARLVMLGDRHQLPPVEVGAIFHDMVALPLCTSHVVELDRCLRTDRTEILAFANAVKEGHADGVAMAALRPINFDTLVDAAAKNFPSPQCSGKDPMKGLEAFNAFRILSPLRQGPYGVEEINRRILQRMERRVKEGELMVIPIVIAQNDYRLALFNGEGGLLVRRKGKCDSEDFAIFEGGLDADCRRIPASLLPQFEYGYCLSVHKSQGSEFDHVLLLMPEGAEVFGREMVYTGITRAKHRLEVWGEETTLRAALAKKPFRLSGLKERL